MDPADFDRWRATYRSATYDEHRDFYEQVAAAYPEQHYYNLEAARDFMLTAGPNRVFELGGWKGELAAEILPEWSRIIEWLNVEIAPQAVTESVVDDPRYRVVVPQDWIWNLGWDLDIKRYDVFVASHVLEHMPKADVIKVLDLVRHVDWMYVDAPLPPGGSTWGKGLSTHIIEIGWDALGDLIESYGFREYDRRPGHDGQVRWYRRTVSSGVSGSLGAHASRAADPLPPAP